MSSSSSSPPSSSSSISLWTVPSVTPEDNLPPPIDESSFACLFPSYREKYLREIWPLLTKTLSKYGITCELNLVSGSMSVTTTRKTWDPSIIIKCRDLIKLLSRSIDYQQAVKILQDDQYCDIIKIKNMVRNKERFVKRRQRLIGPNGATLKAIELVTGCYVVVQGNTVSTMGTIKGLRAVRKVVEDCMSNVHPVYSIKLLMLKKELEGDDQLKNQSWERFMPTFTKKSKSSREELQEKGKGKFNNNHNNENEDDSVPPPSTFKKKSKPKNPNPSLFPPLPTPRKVDLALSSGEYFLSSEQKIETEKNKQKEKKKAEKEKKMKQRAEEFEPKDIEMKKEKGEEKGQEKGKGKDKEKKEKKNKTKSESSSSLSSSFSSTSLSSLASSVIEKSSLHSSSQQNALKRKQSMDGQSFIHNNDEKHGEETEKSLEHKQKKSKKEKS